MAYVADIQRVFEISEDILRITRGDVVAPEPNGDVYVSPNGEIDVDGEYLALLDFHYMAWRDIVHGIFLKIDNLPFCWDRYFTANLINALSVVDDRQRATVLMMCIASCPPVFVHWFNSPLPELHKLFGCQPCDKLPKGKWYLEMETFIGRAHKIASYVIRMILSYGVDCEMIYNATGRDLRPLLSARKTGNVLALPPAEEVDKVVTSGVPLTLNQQVLMIKTILEQAGITSANMNKTDIARLIGAMIGRSIGDKPQNSNIYKAVRGVQTERDFAAVRQLFEDVGLSGIAAKIK